MTPWVRTLLLVVALVLHALTGILYAAAGLVAPAWAVGLLWLAWCGWLWVLVRLWRTSPVLGLLVPPASLGFFLGAITAGERWLGWVA